MTEVELLRIVIENGVSAISIVAALVLWIRSYLEKLHGQIKADVDAAIDKKLEALDLDSRIESTADEVTSIKGDLERLTTRKREHSDQLRRAQTKIARLEGRLGITDTDPNLRVPERAE